MNANNELQTEKNQNDITKNTENQLEKRECNDIGIKEIWKPIPKYEDRYLISNLGRMRSLFKNCLLKLSANHQGYYVITLWRHQKTESFSVHRLVAKVFMSDPPTYLHQINHKDGNKQNNCVDNLEWCTAKENVAHSIKNGLNKTIAPGDSHQGAKLSLSIINKIRETFLKGNISVNELCLIYNVGELAIRRILMNKTWRDDKYGCFETINKVKNILKYWECKNKTFYKKFNKLQIAKVIEMRKNGYSLSQIGIVFKVYRQTIARIIKNESSRII